MMHKWRMSSAKRNGSIWLKLVKTPPQNKCWAASVVWNLDMWSLVWHRRLLSKVCVLHSRHIAQHYLVADDASLEQYFCCDFDQQLKTRYELIAGRAEQGCPPSIPSQHYWYMVQEDDQSFSRWSFSEHTSFLQLDARKYVSITRVRYMDKHHVFWITDVHFTYKAAQKKFKKTGSAYFSNGLWRSCSIFLR